jgi:FtsH-binding integral membrane protein
MVILLSFRIQKMSVSAAQLTFWAYAALVGVSFASLGLIYTAGSIAQVFFITAGTFGALSLYGYTTKRDLSGFGSFLFMGLIGIIIASLVNLYFQNGMFSLVLSAIGVLVFTGLTAWDTQQIKEMYYEADDVAVMGRKAIMGALRLYLDFINLFLSLLRIFGDRN